jgi:hypothetical protein
MASAPSLAATAADDGAGIPMAGARLGFWRDELKRGREALRQAFFAKPDTPKLLREHARLVDRVVREVWRESRIPTSTS